MAEQGKPKGGKFDKNSFPMIAKLDDTQATLDVIKAFQGYGQDAALAVPALQELKMSHDEASRNAVITALAKTEL